MSTSAPLTMQRVIGQVVALPAFPVVIQSMLSRLGDPNANVRGLVESVEGQSDVVLKLMAVANRAVRARGGSEVKDVYVAASLLGLRRVREIVAIVSVARYALRMTTQLLFEEHWARSVACAVCSAEIAESSGKEVSTDLCLIAGLLHNIGQIWLHAFEFSSYEQARRYASANRVTMEAAQQHVFGVDQRDVGGWLALYWGLGGPVVRAISMAPLPQGGNDDPVGDAVHIGQVLGNALDLAGSRSSRVHAISRARCANLSVDWAQNSHRLFGRMEARFKDAMALTASGQL
jgi:HD-like signal output (HDOD) protein